MKKISSTPFHIEEEAEMITKTAEEILADLQAYAEVLGLPVNTLPPIDKPAPSDYASFRRRYNLYLERPPTFKLPMS